MTQKTADSTIEEIHKIRREISDRFGGDVFAIAADAARRQAASNRPVWKPRSNEQSDAHKGKNTTSSQSTSTSADH